MSAHRTRGLLRAAALLAVGASPLLTGAASAAEQPLDTVDTTLGDAKKVELESVKPATDLLSGKTVKLDSKSVKTPSLIPGLPAVPDAPVAVPAAPNLPAGAQLPTAPQARALPADVDLPQVPGAPALTPPNVQKPVLPVVPNVPVNLG